MRGLYLSSQREQDTFDIRHLTASPLSELPLGADQRSHPPSAEVQVKKTSRLDLSRRAFLGAALTGVGLVVLPVSMRVSAAEEGAVSALAFDGDALLVARQTLSRSDNAGATWRSEPAPDTGEILALATHPERPGRIVVGLSKGGVMVLEDGSSNWEVRSSGLPQDAVIAVTIAATQPDTLYATVRGDGLWQSQDAGRSWSFAMDRPWLLDAEHDPIALVSVNLASGMGGIWIYAATEVGLSRVPDCFCRWQDVQRGDAMDALASGSKAAPEAPLPPGEPIYALVGAPSAPDTLFAALPGGIWASYDAGVVWSQVTAARAMAIAVHPTNSKYIVAATDGGLLQSRDSGTTWTAFAGK